MSDLSNVERVIVGAGLVPGKDGSGIGVDVVAEGLRVFIWNTDFEGRGLRIDIADARLSREAAIELSDRIHHAIQTLPSASDE